VLAPALVLVNLWKLNWSGLVEVATSAFLANSVWSLAGTWPLMAPDYTRLVGKGLPIAVKSSQEFGKPFVAYRGMERAGHHFSQ
jgi:hypothetical protein